MGQLAPVQSEALDPLVPPVVAEALPLPLPEADAPELGDVGALVLPPLPVEAPAVPLLPALLPLCAQAAASMAAATATPIAFKTIWNLLGW